MKIVTFKAENIQRLEAVEITPRSPVVVVGGKNGHGKTSTLDAIAMAIGGKSLMSEKPVRQGAKGGLVELTLDDDLVVRRTFTPNGDSRLVVSNAKGAAYSSPQAVLDRLTSKISFDPLAFKSLKAREQAETLRRLVGLDLAELDGERASVYSERTEVNRRVIALKAKLETTPHYDDAPEKPVDVSELMAEMDDLQRLQQKIDRCVENSRSFRLDAKRLEDKIDDAEQRIAKLQDEVVKLTSARQHSLERAKDAEAFIASSGREAVFDQAASVRTRIVTAQEQNKKLEANEQRVLLAQNVAQMEQRSEALTESLERIDTEKATRLAAADFPIDGLSVDEEGVTLSGIPFAQLSAAEQLRISTAIGIKLNPTLRVLLIRDGSLLDDDNLALLAGMAAEHDAQVWLERVGDGKEVSVVIEDGKVKEVRDE